MVISGYSLTKKKKNRNFSNQGECYVLCKVARVMCWSHIYDHNYGQIWGNNDDGDGNENDKKTTTLHVHAFLYIS